MSDHGARCAASAVREAGRAGAGHDEPRDQPEPLGPQRLCHELARCRQEMERLRDRLSSGTCAHRDVCGGCARLEREIAELGNHCVVMELLHGTGDRASVLAAIQDVVINVIGSEDLAIFEPSDDGRHLRPAQAFGGRGLGRVTVGEGPVGRAARCQGWVTGDGPPPADGPELTACVPLLSAQGLEAVLAIWRMLPHKPTFGPADRKVLELLARHGADFLRRASSRERCCPEPAGCAP